MTCSGAGSLGTESNSDTSGDITGCPALTLGGSEDKVFGASLGEETLADSRAVAEAVRAGSEAGFEGKVIEIRGTSIRTARYVATGQNNTHINPPNRTECRKTG